MTLYDRINYGALLQTYALQEYLTRKGLLVEVADYRPDPPNGGKSFRQIARSAAWSHTLKPLLCDRERLRLSDEFRSDFVRLSRNTFRVSDELANHCRYQTMIVGSDQVWNPNLIGRDESWFLDFPSCKRKVSYAASFGLSRLPDAFVESFRHRIGGMQAVSVREETGATIVEGLIGMRPPVVMDPVFLLGAEDWREIMVPAGERGYVLCYYMPGFPRVEAKIKNLADTFAKERGLRVLNIGKRDTSRLNPFDSSLYGVGPREFLGLIDGADLVVTNSFHGTAFSLLLGRPFYTVIDAEAGVSSLSSRMVDLLTRVEASEHVVLTSSEGFGKVAAPSEASARAISTELASSKSFLLHALGEERA